MLEKITRFQHTYKAIGIYEVVVHAVLLAGPHLPRGVRNRDLQLGPPLEQCLQQAGLTSARGCRDSVERPAHEASTRRCLQVSKSLLNVLYLLAHLLDQHLEFDRVLRGGGRDRLRGKRVRLAVEFLHQEVQTAAHLAAFFHHPAHFGHVGFQAVQFFVHVHFLGGQHQFLGQTHVNPFSLEIRSRFNVTSRIFVFVTLLLNNKQISKTMFLPLKSNDFHSNKVHFDRKTSIFQSRFNP